MVESQTVAPSGDPLDSVGWVASLDDLRGVAARLSQSLPDGDPSRMADLAVKMFGTMMGAYLQHLWADPDHPAFLPSVGYYQMYGSPNPDTIYRTATIDDQGDYLLSGHRGSVADVTVMPFGGPTATGLQTFSPFDLDDADVKDDGRFEVVLSQRQPPDAGTWWRLEPGTRTLMLRTVSDEWGVPIEPRVAITRLDLDPRRQRMTADAVTARLRHYAMVVEAMVMSGVRRVQQLHEQGAVNHLVDVDYSANGGLATQWYQEGCFAIGPGEVLLLEARLPAGCDAFSLSLTDAYFSTVDWANAQSSLNQRQAIAGSDGVLRVVVGASDPGIHNWLDTTGHDFGVLQCRWLGGDEAPAVTVRTVAAAALDDHLPDDTTRVTPNERVQAIRARQIGVQLRARW